MDKVKQMIAAGVSVGLAVRECLPDRLQDFCARHGLVRSMVSGMLHGDRRASAGLIAALVAELGGTADEWRLLLWQGARPEVTAKSA